MSQSNKQKIFQLIIVTTLIGVCMSRPNGNAETQPPEAIENLPQLLAVLEKMAYKPYQYNTYFEEPNLLDRTQIQFRPYPNSGIRSSSGNMAGLSMWDSNPQLMSKRQARYRQCYFNPISCFRK